MAAVQIVSSPKEYLKENHPKFYKLAISVGVKPKYARGVLIPADTEIAKLNTKLKSIKNQSKSSEVRKLFIEIKSIVALHMLKNEIPNDFKGGYIQTVYGKGLKIGPVKNDKFIIEHGKNYSKKSNCKLLKVIGAPKHTSEGFLEFSAAKIDKLIDIETPDYDKDAKFEGGHMEMLESDNVFAIKKLLAKQFEDQAEVNKQLKKDYPHHDIGASKNYYIPVVAGMIECAKTHGTDKDKQLIVSHCYESAPAMFYTLVQPYCEKQLLSDILIKTWVGAPYYPADFNQHKIEFYDNHCGNIDKNKIKGIRNKSDVGKFTEFIKDVYEDNVESIFGPNISPSCKFWADVVAFKMTSKEKEYSDYAKVLPHIIECAKMYPGKKYCEEIPFNSENWKKLFKSSDNKKMVSEFTSKFLLHFECNDYIHSSNAPTMSQYIKSLIELNK